MGDKTVPGNYRPISVLPVVSKLFEKLVNSGIVKKKLSKISFMSISMDSDTDTVQNFRL